MCCGRSGPQSALDSKRREKKESSCVSTQEKKRTFVHDAAPTLFALLRAGPTVLLEFTVAHTGQNCVSVLTAYRKETNAQSAWRPSTYLVFVELGGLDH